MLISTTTITGDTPMPEMHDGTLVLKIPITSYDGPIDPELASALQNVLRDWRDGRYPFEVEQIRVGLWTCLKRAAYELIQVAMQEKYGRAMVPNKSGNTARWYLEAQKIKPNIPDMREDITVEILLD
jgi:hypothetical protein